MVTKVYDKAAWHIDAGVQPALVLRHFRFMLQWADAHRLLTADGKELLEFGVDESASLHSLLFTERGNRFMEQCYDFFIGALEEDRERMDEALSNV